MQEGWKRNNTFVFRELYLLVSATPPVQEGRAVTRALMDGTNKHTHQIARGTTITLPSIALLTFVWHANRELRITRHARSDLSSTSTHFLSTSFSASVGRGILSVRNCDSLIWQPPQWQLPPQKATHYTTRETRQLMLAPLSCAASRMVFPSSAVIFTSSVVNSSTNVFSVKVTNRSRHGRKPHHQSLSRRRRGGSASRCERTPLHKQT